MATLDARRDILPQWYMTVGVVHHPTTQKLAENRPRAKEHRAVRMSRFNEQIPKTEIRAARLLRHYIVMTLLKCLSTVEI